ncbi:unnamed protein product [Linum trigynum]|uniref:RWP-RK domain-containing protein n=1 Tax=Linum trigynum TaxID=586398 RepID=A0AAV2EX45_9ROSI
MDAHQIVPYQAPNPDELDLEAIERFLITPERIPNANDLDPEFETVTNPQQTGLIVVPDADDPMTWDLDLFFTDSGENHVGACSHETTTTTNVMVDQLGSETQGCDGVRNEKGMEQMGPLSNYYESNSQSQSQNCYYNGETSTQTAGFEAQRISGWRASNCVCCQVLREIVHSNGEMVTTKLEIHGRVGVICHAILEHRHYSADLPAESLFQFIDYSNKCLETVKRSVEEYCAAKERQGFFIEQDSLSMFYETLCVGYDWNENLEDHSPTAFAESSQPPLPLIQQQQQPQPEESEGGKPPKINLSQQRERAAKLKYKDLADYFDYPIQEAARLLNLCPTVLKKICRQDGVPRWPHRKVKSLKKQMDKVKDFMRSNVCTVEESASLQESLNKLQRDLDITVAGGKTAE